MLLKYFLRNWIDKRRNEGINKEIAGDFKMEEFIQLQRQINFSSRKHVEGDIFYSNKT